MNWEKDKQRQIARRCWQQEGMLKTHKKTMTVNITKYNTYQPWNLNSSKGIISNLELSLATVEKLKQLWENKVSQTLRNS